MPPGQLPHPPSISLALGRLRIRQVLLVLLGAILHLLDQRIQRRRIRGRRSRQPLNLRLLLDLRALHNVKTRRCRTVDLFGQFLVVGPDVDALLLDAEDFGLCSLEVGGAELLLEGLNSVERGSGVSKGRDGMRWEGWAYPASSWAWMLRLA